MRRSLTLAVFPFLVSACGVPGDRASGGGCPGGEVCSPETVYGLRFESPSFGDDPWDASPESSEHPRFALGGRTTITVRNHDLFATYFTQPFQALSTAPAIVVQRVAPPQVTLTGAAVGSAYLRIVDPVTADLFDRIIVEVAAPASIRPRPGVPLYSLMDSDFQPDRDPWAIFAGEPTRVVVALLASDGRRLVDENLQIDGAGLQPRWDIVEVPAPPPGQIVLRVASGGFRASAPVDVVDRIDDVVLVRSTFDGYSDGKRTVCFRALRGGRAVVDVPFDFSSPAIVVASASRCASVAVAPGATVRLVVTAAGTARAFDVEGSAPRAKRAEASAAAPLPGAAGERAEMTGEDG